MDTFGYTDASDDDWVTSAVDEPTVVFDQSGMRVPSYALEGIFADQPVFEENTQEIDSLLARLASLKRTIADRNAKVMKALADPAKKSKLLQFGVKRTLASAKELAKKTPTVKGLGWDPLAWISDAASTVSSAAVNLATSAYDAGTDLILGQSVGTQSAARDQAERLQQEVNARIDSGQVTGDRAVQLQQMAADNVAAINQPTQTFVAETAKETANNAVALVKDVATMGTTTVKILKWGIPIGLGLFILSMALSGRNVGKAAARALPAPQA